MCILGQEFGCTYNISNYILFWYSCVPENTEAMCPHIRC